MSDDTSSTSPFAIEWVVEPLFTRNEFHLLTGSSGVGKSSFLFPAIETYLNEGKFLDYPIPEGTQPLPCGLISCDKSPSQVLSHIRAMKLSTLQNHRLFPITSWQDENDRDDLVRRGKLFESLYRRLHPAPKFLVIEAVHFLMESGKINDGLEVRRFCQRLKDFCRSNDVTILATLPNPKSKVLEGYQRVRDKALGGNTWSVMSGTLADCEFSDLERKPSRRRNTREIAILPRFASPIYINGGFDDATGVLRPMTDLELAIQLETRDAARMTAESHFSSLGEGDEISRQDIEQIAGLKKSAASKWLGEKELSGEVQKVGFGPSTKYKKTKGN